jgi:hypothetical protein
MDQYYNMAQGSSLHFGPTVTYNRYRQPSVDCLWSKAEAILILSLSPYIWGRGDFENTFRMSAKRSIYNYTKSIFDLI